VIHRTCPVCGAELYSAAAGQAWVCPLCGGEVPAGVPDPSEVTD